MKHFKLTAFSFCFCFSLILIACNDKKETNTMGTIERFDAALDAIIAKDAKAEMITEGFTWSEGPLWDEKNKMLIFSDVPENIVYKWTEANGKEVHLQPSGYTDSVKRGGEMGSNGLTFDNNGNLVLCQHGDRRMARLVNKNFETIADNYQGKRFNSPNDAVYNSKGELFFTDPPYGLEKQTDDPKKEIPFQGVFKVKTDGTVVLVTDSLTRPNGLAFLPGEKTLIVANSDPDKPNWYAFDIGANDTVTNARIFFSAASEDKSLKGLPDGLKIDKNGNVFATGPGGVWIFNKEGKPLGRLRLDNSTSNCALSPDEKTLYITNDMYVLRFKMRE